MDDTIKIIQPPGIFNAKNGKEIHDQMSNLLAAGCKTFLLDFQDVKFMDSSGFANLLAMLKAVKKAEGRLVICSINEQVRMILELTNTTSVFEVLTDQAAFVEKVTLV